MFSSRAPTTGVKYPPVVRIQGIFNAHTHPRDDDEDNDGRTEMLMPGFAKVYDTIIGIGNTAKALITPEIAAAKKKRWQSFVPKGMPLKVLVAGLMTEATSPSDILAGFDRPKGKALWDVMKMFLRAASNSNGYDVDDVSRVIPAIKAMSDVSNRRYNRTRMVLMIHAERKYKQDGRRILFLNREQEAIERDIPYIFKEVPHAEIVICHVSRASTIETIEYWRKKGFAVYGELAPHYSEYCIDDIFESPTGGTAMQTHPFCLPIFGTEEDRRAVEHAMVSGKSWLHFGADDACWTDDPTRKTGVKINRKGIVTGGQTQIPEATVSYVIEKFAEAGKLEYLNAFLSGNARRVFNLSPKESPTTLTMERKDWVVPESIGRESPHWGIIEAKVAMGGQTRKYQFVSNA